MTCERTFQGSVRRLIIQMDQKNVSAKNDKITIDRKRSASLKSEDKDSSSIAMHAIQSVDDSASSHSVRKLIVLKKTADTVGSPSMASDFGAEFSAEEVTSEGNEEENGKDDSAVEIVDRKPIATDRLPIDKIATGEVDLKVSNADVTIQVNELPVNEEYWRTFDSTNSEGQTSKAKRPDLLPLRPDSYYRPALNVTPDEVGNATDKVPDRAVNPFQLPVRFLKRIRASTGGSDVGPSISVVDDVDLEDAEGEEAETRRREDIETALAWIQQELRQMKEDDRRLARQLLELRASVHQIRGLSDCKSFNSDEYDLDLDPDWSPSSSRLTQSLDLCLASSLVDGGSGCFASTPAMNGARHRLRAALDEGKSELMGSDSQLFTGRRLAREEVYV